MIVHASSHRVLWLVRHGESNWNRLGWIQGQLDEPRLTRRGRLQAERVATLLATKELSAVFSSDLQRARSTAEIIASRTGCAVRVDTRLRERSFGALEGAPTGSLPAEATGIGGGRVTDASAHPIGGESLAEVATRCAEFIRRLEAEQPEGDLAVVAHGGSIRLLSSIVSGTPLVGLRWGPIATASVHRLVLPIRPVRRSEPSAPSSAARRAIPTAGDSAAATLCAS